MVDIYSAKRLEVSRLNQKETGRSGKKKDSLIFQHFPQICITTHLNLFAPSHVFNTINKSALFHYCNCAFIHQRCSCACNAYDALKQSPLHQQCKIQNSLQTTARDALPSTHKDTVIISHPGLTYTPSSNLPNQPVFYTEKLTTNPPLNICFVQASPAKWEKPLLQQPLHLDRGNYRLHLLWNPCPQSRSLEIISLLAHLSLNSTKEAFKASRW